MPKHIPTTRPTHSTEINKVSIVSTKVFENLLEYAVVWISFFYNANTVCNHQYHIIKLHRFCAKALLVNNAMAIQYTNLSYLIPFAFISFFNNDPNLLCVPTIAGWPSMATPHSLSNGRLNLPNAGRSFWCRSSSRVVPCINSRDKQVFLIWKSDVISRKNIASWPVLLMFVVSSRHRKK